MSRSETSFSPSVSESTAYASLSGRSDFPNPGEAEKIFKGYKYGQCFNALKMGVWWAAISPLVISLFNSNSLAVGGTRVAFNVAMIVCSPLAGAIVHSCNIRKILLHTTLIRGLIYVIIIPVAWIFMKSDWNGYSTSESENDFLAFFLTLMFFDGLTLAFTNVVDIAFGGTDIVAQQYDIPIDDDRRNQFNSVREGAMAVALIVLSPAVAGISYAAKTGDGTGAANILFSVSAIFFITTIGSYVYYGWYMSKPKSTAVDQSTLSFQESTVKIWAGMREGLAVAWTVTPIRYRLLFLALESSFEDAFLSLILAEYALNGMYHGERDTWGNLVACALISFSKIGGIVASGFMHHYWKAPSTLGTAIQQQREAARVFNPLFGSIFVGGLFALLLPIGVALEIHGLVSGTVSFIFAAVGAFGFTLFSTGPKIGFQTLLQGLIQTHTRDRGSSVFGIIASLITLIDAAILMGFSILFAYFSVQGALWITCGLITLHGLVEWILGPKLIFAAPEEDLVAKLLV